MVRFGGCPTVRPDRRVPARRTPWPPLGNQMVDNRTASARLIVVLVLVVALEERRGSNPDLRVLEVTLIRRPPTRQRAGRGQGWWTRPCAARSERHVLRERSAISLLGRPAPQDEGWPSDGEDAGTRTRDTGVTSDNPQPPARTAPAGRSLAGELTDKGNGALPETRPHVVRCAREECCVYRSSAGVPRGQRFPTMVGAPGVEPGLRVLRR